MPYFVGVTGASGVILGLKLASELASREQTYLCLTKNAIEIAKAEDAKIPRHKNLTLLDEKDFLSPVASGSFRLKGTIIAPCSMGTAGRIASGISSNLIERAADIALKERWPLIIVPRETPLNLIHLRNLTTLAEAGAVILPPVITLYHQPSSIEDLINFIVGRILDILGVEHQLYKRWGT
ncbi:3-octaprenyl-4-hydroxybenzoate carboxy-lyase UbiX [Thermosulfidibacter takaii ABI70S6]|uniref:Flavin prenyltransferase UbiX n=1 Tax=Thermosulfidibacter takaii (strain DSM 17441 / JCM 13301 / NBRC 103674 / ABI70S6) TaxID=1298851 RepID=A0A0S3QRV7_THET7|nr:UbiX family flavin prenyltransferase [Thermosulfidibacter takaii]BAT71082.1 3-octaprenyl-4-hydroxybenzoate carboxy-lyase UbiX [Thermosulfidibacter takaii ABI70S6]